MRVALAAIAMLSAVTAAAADGPYADKRCAGAGRYQAMAEGANCFNPQLPDGWTCDDVRRGVARLGLKRALEWAKRHGGRPDQIENAKKYCL